MLEVFKKLRTGPVSAQALREARAALDPFVVETTVRKREDARREAILTGDAKAIAAAEAALVNARLEAERVTIALQELEARIAEADRREADEAVAARIREIELRRDALRKRLAGELAPALRTACEILREVADVDTEIANTNQTLLEQGRRERVASVEAGVTPTPASQLPDVWFLAKSTVIRPVKVWGIAGYGWDRFNAEA